MKNHQIAIQSLAIILSLVISHWSLVIPVNGQTATESAEISDETIKQNVKERLEKIAQQEVTPINQKRAFAGTLSDITNHTLSIKTKAETKQAEIADQAQIINQQRQTIKAENLEIGTYLIAMGYLDENQVLEAKRIVIAEEPTPSLFQAYLVVISEIEAKTLTVKNFFDATQSWQLSLAQEVTIAQTVDGSPTDIQLSDLEINDQLVIIAKPDLKAPTTLDTVAIHRLNSRTIPAASPEKESTGSADNE